MDNKESKLKRIEQELEDFHANYDDYDARKVAGIIYRIANESERECPFMLNQPCVDSDCTLCEILRNHKQMMPVICTGANHCGITKCVHFKEHDKRNACENGCFGICKEVSYVQEKIHCTV